MEEMSICMSNQDQRERWPLEFFHQADGWIHYKIQKQILGRVEAYNELMRVRRYFEIPDEGFKLASDSVAFETEIELGNRMPEFENFADRIRELAKLEPHDNLNVRAYVLCDGKLENDVENSPDMGHGVRYMYLKKSEVCSVMPSFDRNEPQKVLIEVRGTPKKKEWNECLKQVKEIRKRYGWDVADPSKGNETDQLKEQVRIFQLHRQDKTADEIYCEVYDDDEVGDLYRNRKEIIRKIIERSIMEE